MPSIYQESLSGTNETHRLLFLTFIIMVTSGLSSLTVAVLKQTKGLKLADPGSLARLLVSIVPHKGSKLFEAIASMYFWIRHWYS
jgi:hypothetical protein